MPECQTTAIPVPHASWCILELSSNSYSQSTQNPIYLPVARQQVPGSVCKLANISSVVTAFSSLEAALRAWHAFGWWIGGSSLLRSWRGVEGGQPCAGGTGNSGFAVPAWHPVRGGPACGTAQICRISASRGADSEAFRAGKFGVSSIYMCTGELRLIWGKLRLDAPVVTGF
jgi:hypothetical protein